jgi:RimJ/RimL family protein N-acetyltransferase
MLRGERVVLRAITREDIPWLQQFYEDTTYFMQRHDEPWEPQSLDRALARFEARLSAGATDGPHFAIEAAGRCIGDCLLHSLDDLSRICQLGIGIGDPDYRGKGYGREAVRLLLDYAFRIHNLRRVYLSVLASNTGAIRSYQSCGFIEEGRLRQHAWHLGSYDDVLYMGLLREEWLQMATGS